MSAEAAGPFEGKPLERMTTQELIDYRVWLSNEMGKRSTALCDASASYHDGIAQTMEVNGLLRRRGVDTNALGRDMQQVAHLRTRDT